MQTSVESAKDPIMPLFCNLWSYCQALRAASCYFVKNTPTLAARPTASMTVRVE
jgi:hypothetical protein